MWEACEIRRRRKRNVSSPGKYTHNFWKNRQKYVRQFFYITDHSISILKLYESDVCFAPCLFHFIPFRHPDVPHHQPSLHTDLKAWLCSLSTRVSLSSLNYFFKFSPWSTHHKILDKCVASDIHRHFTFGVVLKFDTSSDEKLWLLWLKKLILIKVNVFCK